MTAAILTLLVGIILILAIIAANGYFVAQEFAYMSVDRSKLGAQAARGDAAAQRALSITKRTSFMLSGAQLGITVTGLLVGYVAEPLVGESLGVILGTAGVPAAVSITVGTILALLLATVIQMIFGELYPKNLALAAPEPLARALARSTQIYLMIFGWLIAFFDVSANALIRLVGMTPVHDVDSSATVKDLERIVQDSRSSGDLPEELSMVIDRSLEFPEQTVRHAMIPRSRVGTVRAETTLAEVRTMMATGHSRYPVVSNSEEPLGVVQLTDLLGAEFDPQAPVTEIMRDTLVVPTLMSLPDALHALTDSKHQIACVIDEYGGLDGVLTMEDIAEEFLGELTDEHDIEPAPSIDKETEAHWRMAGDVHVDEVERVIGQRVREGDYETVSGLVIAYHGGLPEVGETVHIPLEDDPRDALESEPVHRALAVTVADVERNVPHELLVRMVEAVLDEDRNITSVVDTGTWIDPRAQGSSRYEEEDAR